MMPAVHTFHYSDIEVLDALVETFSIGKGNSKEIWSMRADIFVEPIGWDALWKLSKKFCKKFEVRYPCIALITVKQVDFDELTADVVIVSVQHEAVTLPESVDDVPLIELWPLEKQKEEYVNAESTAECIDLMRFFYTNLWMPWDDQDDKILLPKTIEDRMSLWLELHNGTIPKCAAKCISMLRDSAIDAQEKLMELDSSLSEDNTKTVEDAYLPPNYITLCAILNARLDGLMSIWTLYEDPLVRHQYLAQAKAKWLETRSKRNVVALWQGGSIAEFNHISKFLSQKFTNDYTLTIMVSAQEGLALDPEEVVFCNSSYEIPEMPLSDISLCSIADSTIKASEIRSCLLMLSEECRIRDLTLNCAEVNTIILMKSGSLHISNCKLYDSSQNSQSDFAQGIVAMYGAKIVIENCVFKNFYSGLVVHEGAQVELRKCVIMECGVGIQMYSGSLVKLDDTTISDCKEQSIRCDLNVQAELNSGMEGLEVASNCTIGSGNLQEEVLIVKQDNNLV